MNKGITSWTEIEGGKESGHTPLPWEADIHMGNDGYEIADMIEPSICEMVSSHSPEETKANAQFIVKACNCHDELVEALKTIDSFFSSLNKEPMIHLALSQSQNTNAFTEHWADVRNALAKTKGDA